MLNYFIGQVHYHMLTLSYSISYSAIQDFTISLMWTKGRDKKRLGCSVCLPACLTLLHEAREFLPGQVSGFV
jgi:hypothetical protein